MQTEQRSHGVYVTASIENRRLEFIVVLDSNRLEAFFVVSQVKNFSKAAQRLAITQSALSQRISKLEVELESSLFIRASSGIQLTPMGEELLRYCHVKQGIEEELLANIKQNSDPHVLRGRLRIAGYSSITRSVLMPSLWDMIRKNPSLNFEILSRELDELPALLNSGEVDYILLNHRIDRAEVDSMIVGYEELVQVRPRRLKGRSDLFLDHDIKDRTTHDFFKAQGKTSLHYDRAFLDDIYGIIEGVKMGWGQAILSKHLVETDKSLEIVANKKKVTLPVVLNFYRRLYSSRLHDAVLEALKSCSTHLDV